MLKFVAAIGAAVIALAQPAAAQDMPPPVAPELTDAPGDDPLSGFRFEATAGYDRLEAYYIEDDTKYYDGANGIRYGSEIGYDAAIGRNVLLGGYVAYSGSSVDRCDDLDYFVLCQKAGNEISGGLRIGGRIGRRAQMYGKIGYSQLKLNLSAFGDDFEETYKGVQFGFGGEYAMGNGAYVKAEFVGSSFGTNNTIYEDLNFERRSVVVGLGYRF
ncbi:outer membrane beta-barrel protein [Sphingomonas sp. Leaf25]|uniref:outer membrane beta-barrel protein n=1 Tax=Sphingomonas sp. Leaf25 TaxID=1735692 RepID=UPI0006F3A54F|nr:outer membrane beta-barrel protein [Sphingomonas sp. Leaf25]KQN03661.1 hypothetical protein ASE78_00830 [Sphingomonas sp. Leaf25]